MKGLTDSLRKSLKPQKQTKLRDGFYEDEGYITLAVNNNLYLISGNNVCMLPNYVPGIMVDDWVWWDYKKTLSELRTFTKTITLDQASFPWVSDEDDGKIKVKISDIDIEHAISCDDLCDQTRKYFD